LLPPIVMKEEEVNKSLELIDKLIYNEERRRFG
jgi:acetylornithine/LysW-gamma-L-lysine aminotransferase